ncbi:uncharacterized protein [Temnothorax longispinosus]|uniref:uncharacterized protein n=1 Tax=Temnothorax longispinosus TaxID=300112 RepID=UPI003A98F2F7
MANPRELWYYFEDIDDGLVKCKRCGIYIAESEHYILKKMTNHIKLFCKHRGEIPSKLYPPVPYKLRKYYTSSDGIATCKECGSEINYTKLHNYTKSNKLFTHNNECERSKWKREIQHDPSIPSSEPRPSTSREYGIDPSAGHRHQEQPVLREQVFEQHLKTIQKSVQVRESANKIYSPSVPSSEPGPSTSRGHDVDPSESRSGEQPDSQVLSFEQTTRNPGAVDTSTTSSSKDVDEFVHPQTPEVLKPVTGEEHLADLYKIDKLIEEIEETRRRDSTIPSPSVPSREYDRDSSERRSGEQPDSQVLSSEQTRKRKRAVDDNVADADTDDTRKRRE